MIVGCVGGDGRRATDRCRRGWIVVLVFVDDDDDDDAVSGRSLLIEVLFPFDNDGLVRDCFTREGGTRVITPTVGVEACNSTQTYTQMCLAKEITNGREKSYSETYVYMFVCLYSEEEKKAFAQQTTNKRKSIGVKNDEQ